MATRSNCSRVVQKIYVQEITSGLENELKLRNDGVGCASPLTTSEEQPSSALQLRLQKAVQDRTKTKTSPRNAHASPGFRGLNLLSPSPSASSDSSISGGVPAHMVTPCKNAEMPSRTVRFHNFTSAGPSRQVPALGSSYPGNCIAAGRGSGNMNGGVRIAQVCTSAVGRGKSPLTSPQTIGAPVVKEKKKRKRPSKKPVTQVIKTSSDHFRATVQELTGMKPPIATPVDDPLPTVEVVRPHPVRTTLAVPLNLPARPEAKPEARSESSSPAMGSSVRCASPIAPVNIVSYRDNSSSSGTSSGKSSLNYTMGYDEGNFSFLEGHQQEHSNPPDYGLPEEEYNYEDPGAPYEARTRAAVSTRPNFQVLEGNRKEDVSNGLERPCDSNSGFGSGSAMPDYSRPSPRINRRPHEEDFPMEEDPAYLTDSLWADSFFVDSFT